MNKEELQEDSEKLFQEQCDKSEFAWLYISQDKNTKFSKLLYKNVGKRPDFLVTLPYVGSVFFDVKAKLDRLFYEESYGKSVPGFNIDTEDFLKLEKLQEYTLLNVWYAIFPYLEDRLTGSCFVVPRSIVSKFTLWKHVHEPKKWKYIQIPKECCTQHKKTLRLEVRCKECTRLICKEFQEKIAGAYNLS